MFEIFNVENGRKFSHTTRLGMEYDKAILERYGVPYVIEYMGELSPILYIKYFKHTVIFFLLVYNSNL
jgi:hypothetical protein